ncbi:MAG: FG-GAP-like repeat-containing protein [Colwellia sp.]|nr:FG-GAP-like repeat-containing protein [Colwellia sp.]
MLKQIMTLLVLSSVISVFAQENTEHSGDKLFDTYINKLPDSVLLKSSDFTVSEIAKFEDTTYDLAPILFSGSGDTDGNGAPEIFIGGWSAEFCGESANEPGKVQLLIFEALDSGTVMLDSETKLGIKETGGTAFITVKDMDLNGTKDLFIVGHNECPTKAVENYLFKFEDGKYVKTLIEPNLAMHEGDLGDFNNDGYPDLIGSAFNIDVDSSVYPTWNQGINGAIALYINDRNGGFNVFRMKYTSAFEDAADKDALDLDWIPQGTSATMGDFDNDGETEIVITDRHLSDENSPSYVGGTSNIIIDNIKFESEHFYGDILPLPDTPFRLDTAKYGNLESNENFSEDISHSVQSNAFDYDNDGDLDILINTFIWANAKEQTGILQVLRNDGDLHFTDVSEEVLYNFNRGHQASHEMIIKDINNDGFDDLISTEEASTGTVPWTWSDPEFGNGELTVTYQNSWSNEIFINTGNGKFVSAFWDGFHELTLKKKDILESYGPEYEPWALIDRRFFPYFLEDGRIGFITDETSAAQSYRFFYDVRAKKAFYTGPNGSNPVERGVPGFSEYYYLTENPDVVTAINAGDFPDGLAHYIAKGKAEERLVFAKNAKIHGSSNNDIIVLREGDEKAFGYSGDDSFDGKLGNDILDGGVGVDSALYTNKLRDYTLTKAENGFQVANQDVSVNHNLINIEKVMFGETTYQFASAENDSDSDGMSNSYEAANDLNSNDDSDANTDLDEDGINNLTESLIGTFANNKDSDGDGVNDGIDKYPLDANKASDIDTDGDGIDDAIDTDDDGDGVLDFDDAFPLDANESVDTDSDGTGNNADTDDDGDGVLDTDDAFPLDATESVDTDGDGIGNNADTDDDGDGVDDSSDAYPLDSSRSVAPVPAPTPEKSSGGGGSTGIITLLILLLAIVPRRLEKYKK